jgi:hypothetical protein
MGGDAPTQPFAIAASDRWPCARPDQTRHRSTWGGRKASQSPRSPRCTRAHRCDPRPSHPCGEGTERAAAAQRVPISAQMISPPPNMVARFTPGAGPPGSGATGARRACSPHTSVQLNKLFDLSWRVPRHCWGFHVHTLRGPPPPLFRLSDRRVREPPARKTPSWNWNAHHQWHGARRTHGSGREAAGERRVAFLVFRFF